MTPKQVLKLLRTPKARIYIYSNAFDNYVKIDKSDALKLVKETQYSGFALRYTVNDDQIFIEYDDCI